MMPLCPKCNAAVHRLQSSGGIWQAIGCLCWLTAEQARALVAAHPELVAVAR